MRTKKSTVTTPQGLTMAEAIKLTAKAESTIRTWIRNEEVDAFQDVHGWWRINRDSLLYKASQSPPKRPQQPPQLESIPQSSPLEKALTEALERERRINDELRGQVRLLEGELLQITSELKALLSKETGGKLSRWLRSS